MGLFQRALQSIKGVDIFVKCLEQYLAQRILINKSRFTVLSAYCVPALSRGPVLQHEAPWVTPVLQMRKLRLREVKLPVQGWWTHTRSKNSWVPFAARRTLLPTPPHPQVWFQNRRAKFRRNERAMLANRSASLLKSYSQEAAIEQPVAPRPTALSPDYLSWTTSPPYR